MDTNQVSSFSQIDRLPQSQIATHRLLNLTGVRIYPSGYSCNHACPFCWRTNLSTTERSEQLKQEEQSLTKEEYLDLISHLPESVHTVFVIGGGEPLTFRGIEEILSLIKSRGLRGTLFTNGSLLSPELADHLIRIGWDFIRVSFNAATPETYRAVNGVDDHQRVTTNIKYILDRRSRAPRRPAIDLNFVIHKTNWKEIEDFALFCEQVGVDGMTYDPMFVINRDLVLPLSDRSRAYRLLQNAQQHLHGQHNIDYVLPFYSDAEEEQASTHPASYFDDKYCALQVLDINSQGATVPCCFLWELPDIPNVRTSSLQDIWSHYHGLRLNLLQGKFTELCYRYCSCSLPIKPDCHE